MNKNSKISIYFGDREDSISLDEIAQHKKTDALKNVVEKIGATQTAFLEQVHGVEGLFVQNDDFHDHIFDPVGDFVMTQKVGCALGVVTADCLPIIIYDSVSCTIAIIHAGWKGLVAGIFQIAVESMVEKIGILPGNLEIYLGPAARPCCYEVQQDFIDLFAKYEKINDFFIKKDDKFYFDSRLFLIYLARNLGIRQEKIYTKYNVCTICNLSFCSYRREKEKARRQISMVCLH